MTKTIFSLLFALLTLVPLTLHAKLKVACVGNSVTWGLTIADREQWCYPAQLQRMLGADYEVRNFGHSGATLLTKGHRPYIKQKEYQDAIDFKADRVIIHLGLNDTDPRNWPNFADDFNRDYIQLISDFRKANPKAKIWICLMSPIFDGHQRFDSSTRDWYNAIQEHILQVARATGVQLINLHEPLYSRPDLFADAIHPNAEGVTIIAQTVFGALTGQYGGLVLPPLYTDGMVLQRDAPLVFRGKADAGTRVKVLFHGQEAKTVAEADGYWQVRLAPEAAGGPYTVTITAGKQQRKLYDVYVGEVWLCSGQSNMEMMVRQVEQGERTMAEAEGERRVHLFNMQARFPTYDLEWSSGVCDSVNRHQFMRMEGWQRANSASVGNFSAIAYEMGHQLADSLRVPVGVICNAVGGTTIESWIDRKTLEQHLPMILHDWYHADYGQEWARLRALKNIHKSSNPLQRHPYAPTYMFESGLQPLQGYAIKGVAWYQGESNAHNAELYERLFPLLQQSWRQFFGQRSLPFYVVQLSSLNRPSWPHFRDVQRRLCLSLPFTWMVVTTDLGDSLDVHYRTKLPVGERLAWQALRHSYGRDIVSEGPRCDSVWVKEGRMELRFSGVRKLMYTGSEVLGFDVAGEDGVFHAAEAHVRGGNVVEVYAKEVPIPVRVRYGWQPFSRANLCNERQLPVSTFIW